MADSVRPSSQSPSELVTLSGEQALRLQVRALVPGEDLARLVPDAVGLSLGLKQITFFSFRHLPGKTVVELHFLRESSAEDLEILGDLVGVKTDDVPHEGKMSTRYCYTVVFDQGTEKSMAYVLAALEGQDLSVLPPGDPTYVPVGPQGWVFRLRRGLGRSLQAGLVEQTLLVAAALAFFGLLDWLGTSAGLGWIAAALLAMVVAVPIVVLAIIIFLFRR